MPGCLGCPTSTSTTISGVWEDFRYHYGPNPDNMGTEVNGVTYRDILYGEDLLAYSKWAIPHGVLSPFTDYVAFRGWFGWKLQYGTDNNGNLPTRVRDHVGLSCAPCPYSTDCNDVRAENMVGSVPAIQNDHHNYYMKIAQLGTSWGFECTFSGCPYFLDTGQSYFYA